MARTNISDVTRKKRNAKVAYSYLAGNTYDVISKIHDISKGQVCRILKNDTAAKKIIAAATRVKVLALPKAIDNQIQALYSKDKDFAYRASRDLQNDIGVGDRGSDKVPINIRELTINNNTAIFETKSALEFAQFIKTPIKEIEQIPEGEIDDAS